MDIKQKKEKLASLKSEVHDFHPILDELFRGMSDITNVENYHGSTEMGADFILYKSNKLFGTIDHIGVIVKLGTIKQDNNTVERQIEECNVERIFKFDNTRGYLQEIWIISNDRTTENAKRKINEKYKNSKIIFIDCDILCRWLDENLPTFWDEISIGISSYIKTELEICKSDDSKLSLIDNMPNVYIEQEIIKNNRDKFKKIKNQVQLPKEESVDIFKEIQSHNIIIIEGEMGSGKSKLLRKLFEHYCDVDMFKRGKVLPIRVSFLEYIEKYESDPEKLLIKLLNKNNNIELDSINEFVLLIDAVDEYILEDDEQMCVFEESLSKVKNTFKSKSIKYVFTTREITAIEKYNCIGNTRRYLIKPINSTKLFNFLCAICTELTKNDRLLEDLKKSELFKDLPNYPMSAILLAKLINDGEYKDLPMTITELYKKYAEQSLGRWDIKRGLQSEQEYVIANKFALMLADYMHANKVLKINYYTAKTLFDDYINARNFGKLDTEKLFYKIINRTGMFAQIELSNTIVFKHRTFIDYFYAQHLHSMRKSIFNFNIYSPTYHNVIMFYIGIQNDCLDVLEGIISVKPQNDFERFYRPFALADYLLAGYATKYNVVENNFAEILIEISKLYRDIITKNAIVPFSALPEAHILWLLQLILREKYSYAFFQNALEKTCELIETTCDDTDIKVIALFFVGCIKVELKIKDPFDYLITFHEKDIPDAAKYIVLCEANDIASQSNMLKNLTRHIKKDIRKSNFKYKDLLTKPIISNSQLYNLKIED